MAMNMIRSLRSGMGMIQHVFCDLFFYFFYWYLDIVIWGGVRTDATIQHVELLFWHRLFPAANMEHAAEEERGVQFQRQRLTGKLSCWSKTRVPKLKWIKYYLQKGCFSIRPSACDLLRTRSNSGNFQSAYTFLFHNSGMICFCFHQRAGWWHWFPNLIQLWCQFCFDLIPYQFN